MELINFFLLLISNPLPQKVHLYPKSPNYCKHIFIQELMDPSSLTGTSLTLQIWGEKKRHSNIMTKIVLRHLAFPLTSFCYQAHWLLTFILSHIIPSFHLCHNAEKEAAKVKEGQSGKKPHHNWLSLKTSASSLLFVFSYANLHTVQILESQPLPQTINR